MTLEFPEDKTNNGGLLVVKISSEYIPDEADTGLGLFRVRVNVRIKIRLESKSGLGLGLGLS